MELNILVAASLLTPYRCSPRSRRVFNPASRTPIHLGTLKKKRFKKTKKKKNVKLEFRRKETEKKREKHLSLDKEEKREKKRSENIGFSVL